MAENENLLEFRSFDKIPRLSREVVVTEKIDGTNAQILILSSFDSHRMSNGFAVPPVPIFRGNPENPEDVDVYAGSRNRWLTVGNDNYGFAGWVSRNVEDLKKLGVGRHYGEWWGNGIQRAYGLKEKRFSLFNTSRWFAQDPTNTAIAGVWTPNSIQPDPTKVFVDMGPECCHVVPTIWRGDFDTQDIANFIEMLRTEGSFAAKGFMRPEGVVVFHTALNGYFKKTVERDASPKGVPGLTDPKQLAAGVEAAKDVFAKSIVG